MLLMKGILYIEGIEIGLELISERNVELKYIVRENLKVLNVNREPSFEMLSSFLHVVGMSGIQAKRFTYIGCHRFPLSIDKNHFIANDLYQYWFLSVGVSTTKTTPKYVILKGRQI